MQLPRMQLLPKVRFRDVEAEAGNGSGGSG